MFMETRIENAKRKTMRRFKHRNARKMMVAIDLELLDGVGGQFISKDVKKLDKADRKYKKAYSKLEKLQEKHGSKLIGIC